jgi:hypothetical protein
MTTLYEASKKIKLLETRVTVIVRGEGESKIDNLQWV